MAIHRKVIQGMYNRLSPKAKTGLKRAAEFIIEVKEKGGKVVVVVGSGPNLHEGVTCLIAELIHKGIIDGVSTSSAVINHEMAGTLEKVKRFDGVAFGFERNRLPADGFFEVSILPKALQEELQRENVIDMSLYRKMRRAKGDTIIKVAGNIAYPTGLRTERLATDVLGLAKRCGVPFEKMAGYGADGLTMIGAAAENDIPVLVTVPQLVGGGRVGLAVADSLSISERCQRIARLIDSTDVIIESALAMCQEVHDGPFETFTGHGIWADWEGGWTYSLADKKIVRIDLDPNLERAWRYESKQRMVSDAVHRGLPKTKSMRMPFRMEMSGFARIPGSLPIIGDIGSVWPVLATSVSDALNIDLNFMSYNQSLQEGQKIREWIVENVRPVDRGKMFKRTTNSSDDPFPVPKHQNGEDN